MSGQVGSLGSQNAPTKIAFDDFWVNQGGITYDSANRRFYVPNTGIYRVTMNPFVNTTTVARLMIGKNTDTPGQSNHFGHAYRDNTSADTLSFNSILPMNANDYIVFYLASGALYNATNDRFNQFTIEQVA